MEIAIVGAGYVGLVTAACLASLGTTVRVVETNPERVDALSSGISPIAERGLDDLLAAGLAAGRLSFSTDPASVQGCRLVIVAVGTLDRAGEWTERFVRDVVLGIARDPAAPRAIVIRSTLLPGTAVRLAAEAEAIDPAVEVGFNPEFTRESSAVEDFLHPDRIVIGVALPGRSGLETDLRRMYAPLEAPVVVADRTSAEMIKMASNVYLAHEDHLRQRAGPAVRGDRRRCRRRGRWRRLRQADRTGVPVARSWLWWFLPAVAGAGPAGSWPASTAWAMACSPPSTHRMRPRPAG